MHKRHSGRTLAASTRQFNDTDRNSSTSDFPGCFNALAHKFQSPQFTCCSAAMISLAESRPKARESSSTTMREAGMLAMKIGYLATGLAFVFVGAVTMGLF
ncbi:hypothetical protein [Parvibaculum sp.]|jgi:hypothetical protein|uniref:hypothetical protein n=1 Tax=Parvibaculum sp. TaxID=2024848 RepID=UPI0025EC9F39|nr:hypothetical protein [Parvibaculum sp.]